MFQPVRIRSYTATSCLGAGLEAQRRALRENRGGLRPCDFPGVTLDTWIGRVEGLEDLRIRGDLAAYDCRNNRLALLGLEQDGFMEAVATARRRYGRHRIGIFLGTSTSGVEQSEQAYARRNPAGELPAEYHYRTTQNTFSVADFTRRILDLAGPAQVVSTACSSSAKVFASAARYLDAGLCDAAVVGGVDSLCQMTLYGFHSLQLVSSSPCRPADPQRDGINIGEAAGFALLERSGEAGGLALLGYGESSDAHHMSAPHPEGEGAIRAMQQALARAGLEASHIDYITLHGTATPANDRAEDRAVFRLFQGKVPCSSTKGFTGHTLGAAGILGMACAGIAIEEGLLPASLNTRQVDAAIRSPIVLSPVRQTVRRVMCNAFGFGGNNASLILGRTES